MSPKELATTLRSMADRIDAALEFGDPYLLDREVQFVQDDLEGLYLAPVRQPAPPTNSQPRPEGPQG